MGEERNAQGSAAPALPVQPAKRGGARRWIFRIVALVGIPLLFFGLLEAGFRVAGYGYDPRFFVKSRIDGRDVYVENHKFSWRFFPPQIARRPHPVVLPGKKDAGEIRVFVLGGSAALGDPEPAYGMARLLEEMLRESCPDRKFRVVNAAMTSINSHVLTAIAKDCAQMEPDIFVVYVGNNEVIGPYGPGTVFSRAQSLPLVRAGMFLQTTRFGQFLQNIKNKSGKDVAKWEQWGGIRMFMDNQVAADDPALAQMYDHYIANLRDIAATARSAGATTIVSTVGVNLRDCSPFASLHRGGLSATDKTRFEEAMQGGADAMEAGDFALAASRFDAALKIDDRFAAAHFMAGRASDKLGDGAKANGHYRTARDLDALRFRADSKINDALRDAFAGGKVEGVRLVDGEAVFAGDGTASPGFDSFVDHVHFDFGGNCRIANALCAEVVDALGCGPAKEFAVEDMRRRVAFTDHDKLQIANIMVSRYEKPPYTNQADHEADVAHWRAEVERGSALLAGDVLNEQLPWHEQCVAANPGDWVAHSQLARYLSALQMPAREAEEWQRVLALIPHDPDTHTTLAQALALGGKHGEAIEHATIALRANPADAAAHNAMGLAYAGLKDKDRARQHYMSALKLRPEFDVVLNNLGVLELEQGTDAEKAGTLRTILEADPGNLEMRISYARLLLDQQKIDEAVEQYATAIASAPNPAPLHLEIGRIEYERADHDAAKKRLEAAIRIDPSLVDAYDLLGMILAESQQMEAAERMFRESLRLRPEHAQSLFQLGVVVSMQGREDEAARHFDEATAADPTHADAHKWAALILEHQAKHAEALARYRKALALHPDWPEVENGIAWILAAHPDPEVRDPKEALRLALKACESTQYSVPSFVDTLATSYAAAGQFDKAVESARNAHGMAAASDGGADLAADIQTRVELFESGKAFVLAQ